MNTDYNWIHINPEFGMNNFYEISHFYYERAYEIEIWSCFVRIENTKYKKKNWFLIILKKMDNKTVSLNSNYV